MSRRFEDIEVLVEGSFLLPHTVYVDHKTGRRTMYSLSFVWQLSKSKRSKGKIISFCHQSLINKMHYNLPLNSASFWFLRPLSYVFVAATDKND